MIGQKDVWQQVAKDYEDHIFLAVICIKLLLAFIVGVTPLICVAMFANDILAIILSPIWVGGLVIWWWYRTTRIKLEKSAKELLTKYNHDGRY